MASHTVDRLIIGAGQADIAMSEHRANRGLPHLVVERDRSAERWRSARRDSLVANGPACHDRLPNMRFDEIDPSSFASKDRIVSHFLAYAQKINAPIRCGITVTQVDK